MIKRLLIANRGEIVNRIIRTCGKLKIEPVVIYTEADRHQPYLSRGYKALRLPGTTLSETYLNQKLICDLAQSCEVDGLHPGYGFLSENPQFAELVTQSGITFVGPSAASMQRIGPKHAARELAEQIGIPTIPGYHGKAQDESTILEQLIILGFPAVIKASAGGGGRGFRKVVCLDEALEMLRSAKREALSAFGDDRMIVERAFHDVRHIEIQIIGDNVGNVIHLGERDCSAQRRRQKVIEEAPAPSLPQAVKDKLYRAAIELGKAAGLTNAATVEFLVTRNLELFFIEVNPRLQVEHPVTEMITGLDLVELQLRIASGEPLQLSQGEISFTGHALEARIYAEDPSNGFIPSVGRITGLVLADYGSSAQLRVEHSLVCGATVSGDYDPMLAKVIACSRSRSDSVAALQRALARCYIHGVLTNIPFLLSVLKSPVFAEASHSIDTLDHLIEQPHCSKIEFDLEPLVAAALAAHSHHDGTGDPFLTQKYYRLGRKDPTSLLTPSVPWTVKTGTDDERVFHARVVRSIMEKSLSNLEIEVQQRGFIVAPVEINLNGNAASRFLINGEPYETWMQCSHLPSSLEIAVVFGGIQFLLDRRIQEAKDPAESQRARGEVTAALPGRVIKMAATVGQVCELGATLCVIESMKMEHAVTAPCTGTVIEISVEQGSVVAKGDLLIRLSC